MNKAGFLVLGGALLALTAPVKAEGTHNYPTLERVDHVLTCMVQHGGQNIENLYACSCEIDAIAEQMTFEEFTEARTYEQYRRMPGDKGGIFRETEMSDAMMKRVAEAREAADKRCFSAKRVQTPSTAKAETATP